MYIGIVVMQEGKNGEKLVMKWLIVMFYQKILKIKGENVLVLMINCQGMRRL